MSRKHRSRQLIGWGTAFKRVLILYLLAAIFGFGMIIYFSRDLPSPEQLQNIDPELTTRIFSSDGEVLAELYTQRRVYVNYQQIPPAMVHAVIAIEDSRFMSHWGVSLRDFARAVVKDIISLSFAEGASTLTQQLARMLYEGIGYEKTITRKIKEQLTALQIERMYSKNEVAEMYINTHWLGNGAYGIEAAALRYFDKTSQELTPAECALLAGQIKHSVRFSPIYRPVSGFQRRNLVLKRMQMLGFISAAEFRRYRNEPLQVRKPRSSSRTASYFVEYVRQWLKGEEEKLDIDILRDGLSIYTTLDTRLQAAADSALQNHLKTQQQVLNRRLLRDPEEIMEILNDSTLTEQQIKSMIRGDVPVSDELRSSLVVQAAFVAIEPSTGRILAMIGGRNFEESQFNRATQMRTRQPGSVFKPIVYATAVDNGIPVTQQLLNQPVVIDMPDGTRWAPRNYDGSSGGPTTLREGLRRSLNRVAARVVLELISPASVVETARRMHLTTDIPAVDAIALGAGGVIPLEITSAYGIFANQGIWVEPLAVTRIVDKYGNVVADYVPQQEMVFSEETAYMATNLLETVINHGTGASSRSRFGFRHTAAGKTGTTNDFSDAWFVGFTPYIVAGTWVGVDNPAVSLGESESGARAALPIWARFMKQVHREMNWPDKPFVRPEGVIEVEICKESKLLPSKYCDVETELFIRGTEPIEHCPLHQDIQENQTLDNVIF